MRIKTKGLSFLVALFFLFISSTAVQAITYYSSPSGTDTSAGSNTAPFKTIKKGLSVLKPGDTLLVKDGTYVEAVDDFPTGLSWSQAITVKAQNARKAIIQPPLGTDGIGIQYTNGRYDKRYITFEGFVVDCVNVLDTCMHIAGSIDEVGVDHIRIINNEIMNTSKRSKFEPHGPYEAYGAYGSGILNSRANDVEYINNDIHDNGLTDYDHGIYQGGGNNILMEGNRIYNNRGSGIKIGWTSTTKNNIARNNFVYNNNLAWTVNPAYGTKRQGRCISTHASSGTKIYNNICWGQFVAGIDVIYEVSDAQVYNNTIYVVGNNSTSRGIDVGGATGSTNIKIANTIVKNNIVYQTNTQPVSSNNAPILVGVAAGKTTIENNLIYGSNTKIWVESAVAPTLTNNLVKDPQFLNSGARDFHLKPSSPAINVGASISGLTTDFENKRRPVGIMDIGAYEYGSAVTSLPLPTPTAPPVIGATPRPTSAVTASKQVKLVKNSSTTTYLDLDAMIEGGVTLQETSTRFGYSGTWAVMTNASHNGGTEKRSSTAGASITFTTSATSLKFVTTRASNRGTFDVYVDGVKKATLDSYNSSSQYQYVFDLSPYLVGAAPTANPTTTPTPIVYEASGGPDLFIQGGSLANTSFGTETGMFVKGDSTDQTTRKSFIRFDMANVPVTSKIQSAILTLNVASLQNTATVTIRVYEVLSDAWGETTTTWNNAPGKGQSLGSLTISKTGPVSLDITNFVKARRAGTYNPTKVSVMLVDEGMAKNTVVFATKQAQTGAPKLTITASP